jgi:hypothetical protein
VQQVGENIWLLRYPLRALGIDFGRNVTLIRLGSGRLVIHSTAPFSPADAATIGSLGEPGWLLDGTLFHDTFAAQGRSAFPTIPYLAPIGFAKVAGIPAAPLDPPPEGWSGQLEVLPLAGMPRLREHVFLHRASRTLIVCDLLFHFAPATAWARFFACWMMRLPDGIGMSAFFRLMIRDRRAFETSLRQLMEWDFDRIIVSHGEMISSRAKEVLAEVLRRRGFEIATLAETRS